MPISGEIGPLDQKLWSTEGWGWTWQDWLRRYDPKINWWLQFHNNQRYLQNIWQVHSEQHKSYLYSPGNGETAKYIKIYGQPRAEDDLDKNDWEYMI